MSVSIHIGEQQITHDANTPTPTQTHCGWNCHRWALGVKTPRQAGNEVMNMQQVMEARRLFAGCSHKQAVAGNVDGAVNNAGASVHP